MAEHVTVPADGEIDGLPPNESVLVLVEPSLRVAHSGETGDDGVITLPEPLHNENVRIVPV
jgi:hypothetical protein